MTPEEIHRATEVEQVQSLCWHLLSGIVKQYDKDVVAEALEWFVDRLKGKKDE